MGEQKTTTQKLLKLQTLLLIQLVPLHFPNFVEARLAHPSIQGGKLFNYSLCILPLIKNSSKGEN